MKEKGVRILIEKLLAEIEEEDIGISLFTTVYQNQYELCFFHQNDRMQVVKILKRLSDDSHHHKEILYRLINLLEDKTHEK